MSHLPIQNKNETTPGRAVSQLPVIEGQLTAVKMGHVHITIRKLITWAQVLAGTRSGISPPLQAGLKCLTHTLDRSRQSVNWNIRHSKCTLIDSCQTRASTDHHHLTVSRGHFSTY